MSGSEDGLDRSEMADPKVGFTYSSILKQKFILLVNPQNRPHHSLHKNTKATEAQPSSSLSSSSSSLSSSSYSSSSSSSSSWYSLVLTIRIFRQQRLDRQVSEATRPCTFAGTEPLGKPVNDLMMKMLMMMMVMIMMMMMMMMMVMVIVMESSL